MRALIFAAGKGERMRPLTDRLPKPLLTVANRALIDYHLEKLATAGFRQVLINTAYLADQIHAHCGDGSRWGLAIEYSYEGPEPLETGGAVRHALSWFDNEPFAMISADVFCDLDFRQLASTMGPFAASDNLAHLWLTHNPVHHPEGDFHLTRGALDRTGQPRHTYTGVGLAKPTLVTRFSNAREKFPLREALFQAMDSGLLAGSFYDGPWSDVGTPERLQTLNASL